MRRNILFAMASEPLSSTSFSGKKSRGPIMVASIVALLIIIALLTWQRDASDAGFADKVEATGKNHEGASVASSEPDPSSPDISKGALDKEPTERGDKASITLGGRVVGEGGAPIEGASIRLTSFGQPEAFTSSSADGGFEARVGRGLPLTIAARAEGYIGASLTLRTHQEEVEIVMRKARQISGAVVSGEESVKGAIVVAGPARTRSGAGGAFLLEDLPPGPVSVEARMGASRSSPTRVNLSEGPAHGIVLRLERPGSLAVVVRSLTGEPLEGASVSVACRGWDEDFTGMTDEDGSLFFEALPSGSARVTASKDGLATAETLANIPPGGEGEARLRLSKAHDVIVHTRLDRGPFKEGEAVALRLIPGDGSVGSGARTHHVTASIGEPAVFEGIAEGSWRALAHHPSYSAEPVPLEVPGPEVTLILERGGKLSGRVIDDEGALLSGVFIIATPLLEPGESRVDLRPARRGRSDAAGIFEVDGLTEGEWLLRPRLDGYSFDEPVPARPGDRNVVLRMEKAREIDGMVVDGRGMPMDSIAVVARATEGAQRRVARSVTNEEGFFRIGNLSPGRYELHAARSQRVSNRVTVEAGEKDVRLVIPVGSTIKGRVVGPNGVPPSRYTVLGFSFIDSTGAFEIEDLDPRETKIWVEAPDLLRKEVKVELQDDRETDLGTIRLDAPAGVDGVVETETGSRLEGATVILEVLDDPGSEPAITSTDEEGRFRFSGLPLGRARLFAMGEETDGAAVETQLQTGEVARVRLQMPD